MEPVVLMDYNVRITSVYVLLHYNHLAMECVAQQIRCVLAATVKFVKLLNSALHGAVPTDNCVIYLLSNVFVLETKLLVETLVAPMHNYVLTTLAKIVHHLNSAMERAALMDNNVMS